MTSMRVCWFGSYDPSYPRNDILLSGLRENGVRVIECRADQKDKSRRRVLRTRLRELEGEFDVVYAAHPAEVPVILAKLTTRKPVVMDALYSMYDAVVNDRQELPWFHPRALLLWVLDWVAALLADRIVVDTKEHAAYWSRFPLVSAKKMHIVYTGVQDTIFYPEEVPVHEGFLVSFHGLYIPLQGIDKIVEAAHLLKDHTDIRFRFIGSGQLSKKIDAQIERLGLTTIERLGRKTPDEIRRLSQEADVILGVFGDTEKAKRVVPNKVFEGMALKKPVITMDAPAVYEAFSKDELFLIPNTAEVLANAILALKQDAIYRQELAERGYRAVMERYTPQAVARSLAPVFENL